MVFQDNADGETRAVILLNQAQYDSEGGLQAQQHFGTITPDGQLTPATD